MQKVNKAHVQELVPDRKALHHAMQRNGWYLPPMKAGLCSVEYMMKVKEGKVFCPKYSEVRLAPCPVMPTKAEFLKEILLELEAKNSEISVGLEIHEHDRVDLQWLFHLLSTINQEHQFFSKSYMPEQKQRASAQTFVKQEDVQFLEGLPSVKGVSKYKQKSRAKYFQQPDQVPLPSAKPRLDTTASYWRVKYLKQSHKFKTRF
jgi:hypothetical protein